MPRNPGVRSLPVTARAVAPTLCHLCCDVQVVAVNGAQLRELLVLEELCVLLPSDEPPSAPERAWLRQQQPRVLAALQSPPRLRLVGVEYMLAAVLGGYEGSSMDRLANQPAITAGLAACCPASKWWR